LIIPDGNKSPYRSMTMSESIREQENINKTALYRHYDIDNQLLYIGISISPSNRFEGHKNTSEWAFDSVRMDTQWFDSKEEALAAENIAIKNEHPKFNKIHSKINRKNKVNLSTTSEIFQFQNHPLRVFTDQDGNPWFIAKDVAEILDYKDTEAMTRKLDEDEIQNLQIVGFGNRGVNLINESGLYSSVFSSRKPEAKTFKRWVTHEVLPSIRKTGSYTKQPQRQIFSDRSIKNSPASIIDIKKPRNLRKLLMEQEEQERLARPKPEPINLQVLIVCFVEDWQSGSMGAPFVPCLGEQAMNLFYRWFCEQKQFENQYVTDRSEIMTELYRQPELYRLSTCVDKKTDQQRVMTMINEQELAEGQSFYDYVTESIEKMEQYFKSSREILKNLEN
jgi:prophage antirepressor-like protein